MNSKNKITVVCGHYGSGKTNLCLNLAKESSKDKKTTLVDFDIVNPYFRSSDYLDELNEFNIDLIAPNGAKSTIDIPSLSGSVSKIFCDNALNVIVDVGGDDVGATVLGTYATNIEEYGYEMIYVINMYRMLSSKPKDAINILREIEAVSRLKATAIVNNSHLGINTTWKTVEDSFEFAKEVEKLSGLPCLYTTVPNFVKVENTSEKIKLINREVKFLWE